MGEFAKQVFAFLAIVLGLAGGWYVGNLVYYDEILIIVQYDFGGNLLCSGGIGLLTFVTVAGVLYKTVHPN